MEYQKIINLIENTPDQATKFRTKNWLEINYDSRETYDTDNQIEIKTSMLKTSFLWLKQCIDTCK